MTAKSSRVDLYNPGLKLTQDFEINHAERLLRMPNNGGWQLPDDSEYKFDFNNGIGRKSNKKGNSGAEKEADNSESDSTPK